LFSGEHYGRLFSYALETGITPELNSANGVMPGAYRADMWVDGQDKARFSNSKNYRDDIGVYFSCDRMFYKENSNPEDPHRDWVFLADLAMPTVPLTQLEISGV